MFHRRPTRTGIYDGLSHKMFNEPEHAPLLNDVDAWLAVYV